MKKAVVFLAAALLVLGSALPLAGYWLTLTLLRQTPAAASSDPGGPCGGSPTGCALSMSCP